MLQDVSKVLHLDPRSTAEKWRGKLLNLFIWCSVWLWSFLMENNLMLCVIFSMICVFLHTLCFLSKMSRSIIVMQNKTHKAFPWCSATHINMTLVFDYLMQDMNANGHQRNIPTYLSQYCIQFNFHIKHKTSCFWIWVLKFHKHISFQTKVKFLMLLKFYANFFLYFYIPISYFSIFLLLTSILIWISNSLNLTEKIAQMATVLDLLIYLNWLRNTKWHSHRYLLNDRSLFKFIICHI